MAAIEGTQKDTQIPHTMENLPQRKMVVLTGRWQIRYYAVNKDRCHCTDIKMRDGMRLGLVAGQG